MKRSSIRKASTFKLQAARSKFNLFLQDIASCPVALKHPSQLQDIQTSSQAVYDICYLRDDSPFIHGLNYDHRYFGFHSSDNLMTYHEFLPGTKQAYLLGDFNGFDRRKHPLTADQNLGKGWFQLEFDLNEFRLQENSRLQLLLLDSEGVEWLVPPPSCRFVDKTMGIFRKDPTKAKSCSKRKIAHLLAYTIDLDMLPFQEWVGFVDKEMDLLECYNTVILKNFFTKQHGIMHKFSLTSQRADLLEDIIERLTLAGVKVVLEWNFDSGETSEVLNPLEQEYLRQVGNAEWQFDLSKQSAMAFYLANITHYFTYFGIGGIHFTKVHRICDQQNGSLLIKTINLLCQRLNDGAVTLASSRKTIAGLTYPILDGGLGFSFTYNFHESLSLSQQHESIYEVVKQIQSSSNCLSLNFTNVQPQEYIYLLFTFLISKRGVFTRGPIAQLKGELKKALRLRRQEQLFQEDCTVLRVDQDCMVVERGEQLMLFNFSQRPLRVQLPDLCQKKIVFNSIEKEVEMGKAQVVLDELSCLLLEPK